MWSSLDHGIVAQLRFRGREAYPPKLLDNSFSPALFTPPSVSLCSDQRLQGFRREHQQARAAPVYEELDSARRRVLEHDPNRVSVRPRNGS